MLKHAAITLVSTTGHANPMPMVLECFGSRVALFIVFVRSKKPALPTAPCDMSSNWP